MLLGKWGVTDPNLLIMQSVEDGPAGGREVVFSQGQGPYVIL